MVPDLAERFEVSPDGDGRTAFFCVPAPASTMVIEVTADDVKRSIERALRLDTPNLLAKRVRRHRRLRRVQRRRRENCGFPSAESSIEGRYVVAIRLSRPDATFLQLMAMKSLRPVCKSAGRRYDDAWAPCGAGPFRLEPGGWSRGRSLRIVRWDSYFRAGLPHLDAVEWIFNSSFMTERFKFERGELDMLREFLSPDLQRFVHDPRWRATARTKRTSRSTASR